jgi:uncharacterized protein YukE
MSFEGMDPEKVQQAISQLKTSESDLTKATSVLTKVHNGTADMWKGKDGTAFAADVNSAKSDVSKALKHIQDLVTHAKSNLQSQQATSNQY